jgi:tripeptidyl-peptidase-1
VHGTSPEIASDFSSGGFSNVFGGQLPHIGISKLLTPFSFFLPVADYQADAVAGYLKALGSTNKGLFNASGRGYPDVSAQVCMSSVPFTNNPFSCSVLQGENVQIVSGGKTSGVAGTSCSSPIFASVSPSLLRPGFLLSLITNLRLSA